MDTEIVQPIRVVITVDEPYAFSCAPYYSPWNKTLCSLPGSDVEFIGTILIGFLNISVKWISVSSYAEMDDYLQRQVELGIKHLLCFQHALGDNTL